MSYYFCADTETTANRASSVIGSVVHQALESKVLQPALDAYLEITNQSEIWKSDPEAYIDLLLNITPATWKGFFVIDGMDQCTADEVDTLVRELSRLSRYRRILLFLSSRTNWKHYNNIIAVLRKAMALATLSMKEADRESEAILYIDTEMSTWDDELASREEKSAIRERLQCFWGGMFIWLALQLQMIRDELSAGIKAMNILARLPHDLSDLYEKVLAPLVARNDGFTRPILELVAAADPPLTLKELRVAANIRPCVLEWNPVDLAVIPSSFCHYYGGYLLEIDENDDKVRFIHPSVAIHLVKPLRGSRTEALHFDLEEAQQRVGLACLTLLSFENLPSNTALQRNTADKPHTQPLYWATSSITDNSRLNRWVESTYRTAKGRSGPPLNAPTLAFEFASRIGERCNPWDFLTYAKTHWLNLTRPIRLTEPQKQLWETFVRRGGPYGLLPLHASDPGGCILWAIEEAHRPLYSYYLPDRRLAGFKLTEEHNKRLQTLLMYTWADLDEGGPLLLPFLLWLYENDEIAFRSNWARITKLAFGGLLAMSSTPEDCLRQLQLTSPLLRIAVQSPAISDYYTSIGLLKRFIDFADQPLLLADTILAGIDVPGRLTVLLESGADPDGVTGYSVLRNPLIVAVHQHDVAIADILLQHGANVNKQDAHGRTPLMRAAEDQSVGHAKLLLSRNASLELVDNTGRTALHFAASSGAVDVLRCILGSIKSSVKKTSILDRPATRTGCVTALYESLHRKHRKCAELLLEAGARRLLTDEEVTFAVLEDNANGISEQRLILLMDQCAMINLTFRLGGDGDEKKTAKHLYILVNKGAIRGYDQPRALVVHE